MNRTQGLATAVARFAALFEKDAVVIIEAELLCFKIGQILAASLFALTNL